VTTRDDTLPLADRIRIRWWTFRDWLRRCPECEQHGWSPLSPRWADDKVAQMLGVARYGCPECGKGAIEERDRRTTPVECLDDEEMTHG
jgi:hypothetical protein